VWHRQKLVWMRNALGNQLQALATRPEGENPVCSYPLKSADVLSAIRKCDNLTRIPLTGSDYTIRQLLHYLSWMAVCPKFVTIASDSQPPMYGALESRAKYSACGSSCTGRYSSRCRQRGLNT